MPILRGLVLLTLLHLCIVSPMQAQEARTEFSVEFRVGSMKYDPKFGSNAKKLAELVRFFRKISSDSSLIIKEVAFYGATSPEGSYQINRRLARGRINALENEVRRRIALPDSIITRHDDYIPWEWLASLTIPSASSSTATTDLLTAECRNFGSWMEAECGNNSTRDSSRRCAMLALC